jgi:hypothetical protein
MKWRFGFLLCCGALITLAGGTVASSQEAPWICCESSTSCSGTQSCCSAELLGTAPCDEELTGFCMEVCKRVAFTSDQR